MPLIHHAAILVADLDRAARFYGDLFGLAPSGGTTLDEAGLEMVYLSAGERHQDLVLARRLDGQEPPPEKRELFHLAFALPPDRPFDAFVQDVADRGVRVVTGPVDHPSRQDGSGSRRAIYLWDPDGYLVEVTQEDHGAA
jgi:catechol 2,3-dioxygenase-like lactoylglutathione lyase family enzyme